MDMDNGMTDLVLQRRSRSTRPHTRIDTGIFRQEWDCTFFTEEKGSER